MNSQAVDDRFVKGSKAAKLHTVYYSLGGRIFGINPKLALTVTKFRMQSF